MNQIALPKFMNSNQFNLYSDKLIFEIVFNAFALWKKSIIIYDASLGHQNYIFRRLVLIYLEILDPLV
jgi:hypothetical protein